MIELIHGDCMDLMRGAKDKQWDLAICDPPYGIGMDGGKIGFSGGMERRGTTRLSIKGNVFVKKKWDRAKPDKTYFEELFRVSNNQIIWGGNYFIDHLTPTSCFLVWDKENGVSNFADCELAWSSFKTATRKFKFKWHGFFQENMRLNEREKKIHPTQKPVALYKWLLKNYANPGDKILDTHLGSGSIAIACHDYGYDLTATEIDADYFKAAQKRLRQHQAQTKLFQ